MFKPMLAGTVPLNEAMDVDSALVQYPFWASPKLDGVRATVQSGRVYSRNLKLIPNKYVQHLFGREELNSLDGELIVGSPVAPDAFRRTSSAVMSVDGEPNVFFYVFDCFQNNVFKKRWQRAEELMRRVRKRLPNFTITENKSVVQSCLQLVEHEPIINLEDLLHVEAAYMEKGYEGIMLRDPDGLYKQGRSTLREGGLLKLKRFMDSEAEILRVEELMHNANPAGTNELGRSHRTTHKAGMEPMNVAGALVVRDLKTAVVFNIGSGFDATMRVELWEAWKKKPRTVCGRLVKYRYFPTGGKDKPRFPVFLGFRDGRDM